MNLFSGRFVKAVPELHRSESGDICDGAYGYAVRARILQDFIFVVIVPIQDESLGVTGVACEHHEKH